MKIPGAKHHQSSITRDIWLCTLDNDRTFKKKDYLFRGEDRDPVWSPDENAFYYLSEEKGSFNIFKNDLTGQERQTDNKNHTTHPVRFLTSDKNGTSKKLWLADGRDTVKEGDKVLGKVNHLRPDRE